MKISYAIMCHNEGDELRTLIDTIVEHITDEDEIVLLDDYSTNKETKLLIDTYVPIHNIVYEQRHLYSDFAGQKNHLRKMCSGDYIFNLDADEVPHKWLLANIKEVLSLNDNVDLYLLPRLNVVHGIGMSHVNKWGWNISAHPRHIKYEVFDTDTDQYELLKKSDLIINEYLPSELSTKLAGDTKLLTGLYKSKYNNKNLGEFMAEVDGTKQVVVYKAPIVNWPDRQGRIWKNIPNIRWEGYVHERIVGYTKYSRFPDDMQYSIIHVKEIAKQVTQNEFYDTI
jgi:glycosyltransferase involved in cell wall biosynthesis